MTDVHAHAQSAEALEVGRGLQVAPGDLVAHPRQHVGDGAHARAADTDDVDALGNRQVEGFATHSLARRGTIP